MRKLSRFLSLILSLTLMALPLTGSALAEGAFHESEWIPPEGYAQFTNMAALPGGGFAVAAMTETDGSWALLFFPSLQEEPAAVPFDLSEDESITSLRAAPDGALAALIVSMPSPGRGGGFTMLGGAGGHSSFLLFEKDGTPAGRLELDIYTINFAMLSGRRIVPLTFGADVLVYNQDGDVQTNLQHSDANDIIRLGDHLLIVEGTRLIELNPEDGSVIRSIERGEDYSAALAASPDGRVWGAGSQGMYYLMPDGTEYIKICDSTRYLIGAPDAMVTGLCALDGGTLVVEMGGNSGSLSLRPVGGNVAMQGFGMRIGGGGMADYAVYTYDANLDISSAREFTVTALHYSRKLHQVVSNFQREHPELDVRMEFIMPDDDTETPLLDGIRVLNTRLFSGFAGDILILDSLNLNRYIARGLLKPLDALAADLGLLPGIWEGSHSDDGHIYYVPAAFSMETLWGLAERIAGVDSVLSLLSIPLDDGQYLFYPRTPEQLLTLFYPACEGAFLNANGKPDFSSAAFKDFLNTLLEMFLLQGEIPAADSGPFSGRISSGRQARAMANFGEMQALINGAAALSVTSVMSLMQLSIPYTFMGAEESGFISIPSLYDQGAAYRPILMAGISAQTSQDALCEAFLQSLFSDEIQNLETGEGLPSCLKAFEKIVEDEQALNASSSMMRTAMFASDGGNPIEMKQPDDACYDALTTLAKNVYIPIFEDETLMAFITEETAAFFRGEISAETAQNALYIRTMAYLNE